MKKTLLFAAILLIPMTMPSQPGSAQTPPTGPQDLSTEKIIRQYYAAFEKKDWNLMEQVLADDFTFSSPVDDHITVSAFKERCWPNCYKIKRFDVDKLLLKGDEAFLATNGWTNDGKLFRNGEYFRLKDGKIVEYECFFGRGINYPNSGK
jgi:ketosteroid isomerase-like protein